MTLSRYRKCTVQRKQLPPGKRNGLGRASGMGARPKKQGVAILFKPDLNLILTNMEGDFNHRALAITAQIDNSKFRIINIYAHNTEDRAECETFFAELYDFFDPILPHIFLGDFNMVENIKLDRSGGNPREKHTWGLQNSTEFKNEFLLVDSWRFRYPDLKEFTWRAFFQKIQSRLDRIYVSASLIPLVNEVEITPFSWSDHDFITMDVTPPDPPNPRGPGYWKINNTVLEDVEYKQIIKEFWNFWRGKKDNYSSLLIWWDMGKIKIKKHTIRYSVRKKHQKFKTRNRLLKKINYFNKTAPPPLTGIWLHD